MLARMWEEMDPRQSVDPDDGEYALICWECETSFTPALSDLVEERLSNGTRISIIEDKAPRNRSSKACWLELQR